MHPEQVVEQVRQTLGKEVPRELAYEAARQTWKEWIHNRAADLSAVDLRVLFGHFEFQGVRYASTAPSEVVPNDFTFTPEMVPDAVDLVVFGHIHMHQTVGGKIVYVGAPERIDWGERLDPKGFLALRPEGTWSFIELPARPMDKIEAVVGMGDDVTEKVLAALPPQVDGHLVRIEITLPDELRNRLDEKRLADHLRNAFHYEVKFVSSNRPRVMTEEFTLDPGRLLSDYVDKVLADHPKREAIKVEARRVLKEALA
jgi:exonuclease SbcD